MAKAFVKLRQPSALLEVQGQNVLLVFEEEKPLSVTNNMEEFPSCGHTVVSCKQLSLWCIHVHWTISFCNHLLQQKQLKWNDIPRINLYSLETFASQCLCSVTLLVSWLPSSNRRLLSWDRIVCQWHYPLIKILLGL